MNPQQTQQHTANSPLNTLLFTNWNGRTNSSVWEPYSLEVQMMLPESNDIRMLSSGTLVDETERTAGNLTSASQILRLARRGLRKHKRTILLGNFYAAVHFTLVATSLLYRRESNIFWPANGVIVAGLLRLPVADHPSLVAFSGLWQLTAYLVTRGPHLSAAAYTAINLFEILSCGYLTRYIIFRKSNLPFNLYEPFHTVTFLAMSVLSSSLTGIIGSAYKTWITGRTLSQFSHTIVEWGSDDVLGLLMITPAFLIFPTRWKSALRRARRCRTLWILKGITSVFVFGALLAMMYIKKYFTFTASHPRYFSTNLPRVIEFVVFVTFPLLLVLNGLTRNYTSLLATICMSFVSYGFNISVQSFIVTEDERRVYNYNVLWSKIYLSVLQLCNLGYVIILAERQKANAATERQVIDRTCELEDTLKDLRGAEKKAQDANAAKANFMAFLCHELRNPLHAIANLADFLMETTLSEDQTRNAKTIKLSSDFMVALVNDVLDMSKFEAGKVRLETVLVDFEVLVHSISTYAGEQCAIHKLNFHCIKESVIPKRIQTDPTRLQQVLYNLVSNAVKFTEATGTVSLIFKYCKFDTKISASKNAEQRSSDIGEDNGSASCKLTGEMTIKVVDSGIGMTDDVLNRLFQPYEQASLSTSREYGGSGLGLAICKAIIQAMGGTIGVTSHIAEGTTFMITIPLEEVDEELDSNSSGTSHQEEELPGRRWRHNRPPIIPHNSPASLHPLPVFDSSAFLGDVDATISNWKRWESPNKTSTDKQLLIGSSGSRSIRSRGPVYFDPIHPSLDFLTTPESSMSLPHRTEPNSLKSSQSTHATVSTRSSPRVLQTLPEKLKILIVDDSAVNRMILARMFTQLSYEIVEAENGKEAVDKFVLAMNGNQHDLVTTVEGTSTASKRSDNEKNTVEYVPQDMPIKSDPTGSEERGFGKHPDCEAEYPRRWTSQDIDTIDDPFGIIFLDINMPVMDGTQCARELRKLGSRAPIVATTANNVRLEDIACFGYTDMAGKPFRKSDAIYLLHKYGLANP